MDLENYRPYDTYFYYDEPHDTLFLVASSVPYDLSNEELKYNVGIYLYIVPDRTKSEIEFDWLCTFADGYIGKRSAFPEGTFNHPVVTTPSVSLTDYNLDWKYKNIYSY